MVSLSGVLLGQENEVGPLPARQNPILRDYFRRQFVEMGLIRQRDLFRRQALVERFVDGQIDHFMEELRTKLDRLKTHFADFEQAGQLLQQRSRQAPTSEMRTRWHHALRDIERRAGDLHSMLSYVFRGLEAKEKFNPQIDERGPNTFFVKETRFIGEQIAEAERRIVQYFFKSDNTVRLDELRGENMLVYLYRTKEMAKRLEEHWRNFEKEENRKKRKEGRK